MPDTYIYNPDPVNPPNPFNLTYTTVKILSPVDNYDLLTEDNIIISKFSPIYFNFN